MTKLLALTLLFSSLYAHAEFAQISDPDGYTNLRDKPNTQSKIVRKIPTGAYVYTPTGDNYADFAEGDWHSVYDVRGNQSVSGWVHQSRLLPLQNYPAIPVKAEKNGYSCLKNGMGVRVEMGKFDFAAHKQEFTRRKDGFLSHYRGKPMFGTDGTQPSTRFSQISFVQNGKTIVVPQAQYEFLFNPYFDSPRDAASLTACHYRATDDTLFLNTVIGDGAAFTEVLFVFQQGSLKTVLASLHPAV